MSVVVLVINEIRKHPIIALILLIGILAVPILLVAILVTVIMSIGEDDDECDSGSSDSGSTTVDANFSVNGGKNEKEFLKWCAQQHLDASETAGLAGNAIIEAGGWNGTGNYFGLSTPGTQTGESGTSSSQNPATYLNWTILHKGHQKYSQLSKCPSAFKKYKSLSHKTPYQLAGWWNTNVLGTQDPTGPKKKGDVAEQVYKQIAGGHSSVSSSTASTATSSQKTTSNGNQVSGSTPAAKIYNYFVSKEHFSAAAAAGVVAIAQRESGGNTSSPDPSSINPKASNGSHTGIFQWTSDRLSSGRFIKSKKDETISNELKVADYELHHSYSKVMSDVKNMTSPSDAAKTWSKEYEGVSLSDTKQTKPGMIESIADGYYKKYGGTNPGDDSSSNSGSSSCNNSDSDDSDGTGSVKEKPKPGDANTIWTPGKVPSDMKQYIHSPTDVGMHYGSSTGWSQHSNGQCVDFAVSYGEAIWGLPKKVMPGNGKDIANDFKEATHGSISHTPRAGDICSTTNTEFTGSESQYGHTFIVEHVLSNGDFIIAEENWPAANGSPGTGVDVHRPNTWNYAIISKSDASKIEFCKPGSKYHLKWSK